jgi:hypothetical protein
VKLHFSPAAIFELTGDMVAKARPLLGLSLFNHDICRELMLFCQVVFDIVNLTETFEIEITLLFTYSS